MREGLAALGIGVAAVACCGLVPIVLAAIGGAALAPLLGVGAGALLALILIAVAVWRGHRGSCGVEPGAKR